MACFLRPLLPDVPGFSLGSALEVLLVTLISAATEGGWISVEWMRGMNPEDEDEVREAICSSGDEAEAEAE